MAAIDFPNSPTLNQEFSAGGRTWKWDGSRWLTVASTTIAPTAHASSHGEAGTDPVIVTQNQVTNLITDLAAKATLVSPSFTTPSLGVATATSINGTTIPSSKTLLATDSTVPVATGANSAASFGFLGMPQVSTATGVSLTATHAGKHIYTTATGQTHTIPANGTTPLEVGTTIVFVNAAAVTTSIAITTDTLILAGAGTTGTRTLGPHGMATAIKITSTSWIISGNGLS